MTEPTNETWVSRHWVRYTFSKNLFFLLWLPTFVSLNFLFLTLNIPKPFFQPFGITILLDIGFFVPLCLLPVFLLLWEPQRCVVVKQSPKKFIIAEKIDQSFVYLDIALVPIALILLVVFIEVARLGIANWIIASGFVLIFVFFAGIGSFVELFLMFFELPQYLRIIRKIVKETEALQGREHNFKKDEYLFYPSEAKQANARFVILSEFLSAIPVKTEINEKFYLFREGLTLYNDYLKAVYGFVMRDPERLYDKGKLLVHLDGAYFRNGLKQLTEQIEVKKEPFEIIGTLKKTVKEPNSLDEICSDIEVEPRKIRKWVNSHLTELMTGAIIPIGLALIPYIWMALQNLPKS